jgi:hypothetical protein
MSDRKGQARFFVRLLFLLVGVLAFSGGWNVLTFGQQAAKKPQGAAPASWVPRSDDLGALAWRFVGPQGNRVSAVVCDSNDPNIYYAGACAGGVWKSSDGGTNWEPVFDEQSAQSIGSLAIAPSDSNQIWAGTGEAFIRSNVLIGDGIYKSMDAGKSWQHSGLEKSGRIGRIVVHPRDPNIVFAAALGHGYGPQKERGVYRTKDGGKTWEQVLFVDENTGCSGLAMDPNNPRLLFAGMWSIVIKTWGKISGGPGSGSKDTGCRLSRSGRSMWPSRRQTPTAFMPSSRRAITARSGVPMTAGKIGGSQATSAGSTNDRTITRECALRPMMRIRFIFRRTACT